MLFGFLDFEASWASDAPVAAPTGSPADPAGSAGEPSLWELRSACWGRLSFQLLQSVALICCHVPGRQLLEAASAAPDRPNQPDQPDQFCTCEEFQAIATEVACCRDWKKLQKGLEIKSSHVKCQTVNNEHAAFHKAVCCVMCWILNLESGVMRNATGYSATAYSYIEILAEPRRLEFRMDVECWTFECLNLESSSLQNRNSQQVTGDMSIVKLQQVRTLNISTLNFWTLDTWNLKLETYKHFIKHLHLKL
jgi:hypothetical protein